MPRTQRIQSATGIYHALLRGINQQRIFEEDEDYQHFIECMREASDLSHSKLLAYCLMDNHVHLLIENDDETPAQFFKRLGARYVFWFNWKYQRSGHLFQDRFKSEPVGNDAYFVTVLRYIWHNPVKAGLCSDATKYPWSSVRLLGSADTLIDECRLAEIASPQQIAASLAQTVEDGPLEITDRRGPVFSDNTAAKLLKKVSRAENASAFLAMELTEQLSTVIELRHHKMPIRQIARITGLSKGVVERWSKPEMQDK
jgi:REP element-mobilizing transposase RayT